MANGPNSFWLSHADSFQTNDPSTNGFAQTEFRCFVTINWDYNRTTLTPAGIQFSGQVWLGAGAGPVDAFDFNPAGGPVKIGTIKWSGTTLFQSAVQDDPTGPNYREVYTPMLRLYRTFTPLSGPPQITEVPQDPAGLATDYGSYKPKPK